MVPYKPFVYLCTKSERERESAYSESNFTLLCFILLRFEMIILPDTFRVDGKMVAVMRSS